MNRHTTTHDKIRWAVAGAMYSLMRQSIPEWEWTQSAEENCADVTKVIWENYTFSQITVWRWTAADSSEVKNLATDLFVINNMLG